MQKTLIAVAMATTLAPAWAFANTNTPGQSAVQPEGVDMYQDRPAAHDAPRSTVTLEGEPCQASKRDYAAYFEDLYQPGPSLLNECALGSIINFDVLKAFDPFGKLLAAIKGAVCGFIRDEIHDPFVSTINDKISQANAWTRARNNGYSDWIDEETRNLQHSIYDPTTRFEKPPAYEPSLTQGDAGNNANGNSGNPTTGTPSSGYQPPSQNPVTPPNNTTPTPPQYSGGSIIIDGDHSRIDYGNNKPNTNNSGNATPSEILDQMNGQNWRDMYNVYQ